MEETTTASQINPDRIILEATDVVRQYTQSDETITAVAKQKPYYFVMRDSSLASDSVATNFDQIFATYSPDTVRKVL